MVLPILGALLLATVLVPAARWLESRRWPPALAALTVMCGAGALLVGIGALVVPTVATQLDDVGRSASQGLDELLEWAGAGPFGLSEGEIERTLDRALERGQSSGGVLVGGLVSGAILIAELIAGLLLAVVLLFFFVKDGERIWSWVVGLFPESRQTDAQEIGSRAWRVISVRARARDRGLLRRPPHRPRARPHRSAARGAVDGPHVLRGVHPARWGRGGGLGGRAGGARDGGTSAHSHRRRGARRRGWRATAVPAAAVAWTVIRYLRSGPRAEPTLERVH